MWLFFFQTHATFFFEERERELESLHLLHFFENIILSVKNIISTSYVSFIIHIVYEYQLVSLKMLEYVNINMPPSFFLCLLSLFSTPLKYSRSHLVRTKEKEVKSNFVSTFKYYSKKLLSLY